MNTCKDCRWWYQSFFNFCEHEKLSKEIAGESDRAWCDDNLSGIETGPDFGCIHWEEKK